MPHDFTLITDGACLGNPGPGGWGALVRDADGEVLSELSGGHADTTNNRMEIQAVLEGLKFLSENGNSSPSVLIRSDSKYFIDAFNKGWVKSWQKNGWKTAAKKPVKNQDLWQELISALGEVRYTLEWVKGHAGDRDNERADYLATSAARNI